MLHFIISLIIITMLTYALGSFFYAAAGFFGMLTLIISVLFVGIK